jgi:hypothetical protein
MRGEGRQGVGERRGWKNGERWEKGGEKLRETGDKAKRKKGEGREKEEEEWAKTTPGPPPHRSGTVFVFLESQMHITPLSFEN